MNNIVIIGGDKRQKMLSDILSNQGFVCRYIDSEEEFLKENCIFKNDIIVLPVPISKDREYIYSSNETFKLCISDVLSRADSTNFIFGGRITEAVKVYLTEKKIGYFDYSECEEFEIYNAYLTGLGAVKLLLENTEYDIKKKKALITGFGKVARFTAQEMLKAGCDVYVCARNKVQTAQAECSGCKIIEFEKRSSCLYLFDFVFNTVPENIFNLEDVVHLKGKYFELASAPFGVRKEFFKGREDKYIFGGSLPGKYLPCSAAEKLAEITVKHINLRNGGD